MLRYETFGRILKNSSFVCMEEEKFTYFTDADLKPDTRNNIAGHKDNILH